LHGFDGAGLFRRLDYPGAPTEFVDSSSVEEIIASGEFEETCKRLLGVKSSSGSPSEVQR
jgi:hypothetical protein